MASRIPRKLFINLKNARLYSAMSVAPQSSQALQTVEKINGIKVLSLAEFSPMARLTLAVKAGARNELLSEQGVTHVLRYMSGVGDEVFSSHKRSHAMKWFGGGCSASTTRELAYYSLEFVPDDIEYASDNLVFGARREGVDGNDWANSDKLQPQLYKDLTYLESQPGLLLTELLHQAAFRDKLGNSLFCPAAAVGSLSTEKLTKFFDSMYTEDRMFLISSGVSQSDLASLTEYLQVPSSSGSQSEAATRSGKTTYYGGEQRQHYPGYDTAYVTLATEGASLNSDQLYPLAILKCALGSGSTIKRCERMPGSKLASAVAGKTAASFDVSGVNYSYSDAGLVGFTCAASSDNITDVLMAARAEFINICTKGLSNEEFNRAKAQLKSEMSMAAESEDNLLCRLAEAELLNVSEAKSVDDVKLEDVNKAAKKLLSQKLTMSAVGNLSNTPYLADIMSAK